LLDDKSLRRAGLDYWHKLDYQIWDSFAELLASDPAANFHFATTKTANSYLDCAYKPGDYIVFGPESRGLPEDLLSENAERCITIR
jgi:tRNA (cytidine/uridine-2'-O-)-methyltransferase